MSEIGYNLNATIYTLEDEKIQDIKCKQNTKRFITSGFVGSGIASTGQTLELLTPAKLEKEVQASQCRCYFDNNWYVITGIFQQDVAPIKSKNRKQLVTVLSLQ